MKNLLRRQSSPIGSVGESSVTSPRTKRWRFIVAIILVGGILWASSFIWRMNTAESTPNLVTADVGIVLGASMWGDVPSPGLKERLEEARLLYESGRVPRLIVSGGLDDPSFRYTEAEGMQRYLIQHGIPKEHILLENEATSTYENLLLSQQIMKDHGYMTAIIVTHTYHGPRAMEIARTLDYRDPQLSLTDTEVLSPVLHQGREVFAYGKWTLQRLLLAI